MGSRCYSIGGPFTSLCRLSVCRVVYCGKKMKHYKPILHRLATIHNEIDISHETFVAVCGGTLTASNKAGHVYSHARYSDHNYDNNENCEWLIRTADPSYRVRFRFLTFEIEQEADCGFVDYSSSRVYEGTVTLICIIFNWPL